MTFIKTTSPSAARGAVFDMYARQQSSWGFVPNYAKVFCHRPEVMARWAKLLAEIKRPMSKRYFELVTFAAAVELRHTACALAHGKVLTEFFTNEQVCAMRAGTYDGILSDGEQAMMHFARQVASDASRITSGTVEQLRGFGFTDGEVFDIAAAAAGRAFFTKVLDALGVESDASFMNLDESFRKSLTVGRPVSCREVEMLPVGQADVGP